eukprot:scaffold2830_cov123-Isochrysis_galbana.AAC.6
MSKAIVGGAHLESRIAGSRSPNSKTGSAQHDGTAARQKCGIAKFDAAQRFTPVGKGPRKGMNAQERGTFSPNPAPHSQEGRSVPAEQSHPSLPSRSSGPPISPPRAVGSERACWSEYVVVPGRIVLCWVCYDLKKGFYPKKGGVESTTAGCNGGIGAWWCLVRGLGSGQCACRLLARDVLDVLRQRFGRGSGGGENGWTTTPERWNGRGRSEDRGVEG